MKRKYPNKKYAKKTLLIISIVLVSIYLITAIIVFAISLNKIKKLNELEREVYIEQSENIQKIETMKDEIKDEIITRVKEDIIKNISGTMTKINKIKFYEYGSLYKVKKFGEDYNGFLTKSDIELDEDYNYKSFLTINNKYFTDPISIEYNFNVYYNGTRRANLYKDYSNNRRDIVNKLTGFNPYYDEYSIEKEDSDDTSISLSFEITNIKIVEDDIKSKIKIDFFEDTKIKEYEVFANKYRDQQHLKSVLFLFPNLYIRNIDPEYLGGGIYIYDDKQDLINYFQYYLGSLNYPKEDLSVEIGQIIHSINFNVKIGG